MPVHERQASNEIGDRFNHNLAFIIGIDNYRKKGTQLRTAVNDAKAIARILDEEQGFEVHPPLLDATKADIENLLSAMAGIVQKHDRVFFYFAGHGIANDSETRPEGYIIPADASNQNQFIPMHRLHQCLTNLPCRHMLLVLDCCFSGSFKWASPTRNFDTFMPREIYKEHFDRYVRNPAWQVLTSAAYNQKALDILAENTLGKREESGMKHSPFARALLNGLAGHADVAPGDGLITSTELYLFIRKQVESRTIRKHEWQRQTPLLFHLENHDMGEFLFRNRQRPLMKFRKSPIKNPYKGLQAFEEDDKELFFGRNEVVDELLERIKKDHFVVVTGASGTGKSSLVKAGLIPKLREKDYQISKIIRPGEHPAQELDNALLQLEVNLNKPDPHISVLVIDQLEELYTQNISLFERNRFIITLNSLSDKYPSGALKIIVTVRSDFETHFRDSKFRADWEDSCFWVPAFTMSQMRDSIIYPAEQAAICFEPPELVDRLITKFFSFPGSLPLLSFTMSEAYLKYEESNRDDRKLSEEDFENLEGGFNALNNRANITINTLKESQKKVLKKIMLRLVSLEGDEPAGKKVSMEDLNFSAKEMPLVKVNIEIMVENRLLMKHSENSGAIYIEPAHDALVRSCTRQKDWIEEYGKANLLLLHRLEAAAKEYKNYKANKENSKKNVKGLLWNNDPRLEWAIKQKNDGPLNMREKNFVEESDELRRKNFEIQKRRKKRLWTIAITTIVILSVLLLFSIFENKRANKEATIASAGNYTSQAQLALPTDPARAIRLAEEAYYLNITETLLQVLTDAAETTLTHPFYTMEIRHQRAVHQALFSPSGHVILTLSSDKTARLWDRQGTCTAILPHKREVYWGQFSADGKTILTVSGENAARLWNDKGKHLRNFEHRETVTTAAISPDGSKIFTASIDGTAGLWDINGRKLKDYSHESGVNSALFSPTGNYVLTVTDNRNARLIHLNTHSIKAIEPGVLAAVFSKSGGKILALCVDQRIRILDIDGKILAAFEREKQIITMAIFTPDDSGMLSAFLDGTITLYLFKDNKKILLNGHRDFITSVAFSPDGNHILTASADNTAKLWDLKGNLKMEFDRHGNRVTSAMFSPDGLSILTASRDNTAKLWDLSERLSIELDTHETTVHYAEFSPDGSQVVSVSGSGVKLWSVSGTLKARLTGHTKRVNSACFSKNNAMILTASADSEAVLWNTNGQPIQRFKHGDNVETAVFSPDEGNILTASYDGSARLWNLSGKELARYKHEGNVNSACFSPDGKTILTASDDKTAGLWNLEGGLIRKYSIHSDVVRAATFSPDGRTILTISTVARLWDLEGVRLAGFTNRKRPLGNNYNMGLEINDAMFSPDGSHILTVTSDNKVQLWDLKGQFIHELGGHENVIYSAVFSPDSRRILTASADETAKLWDLRGNLLSEFDSHGGMVVSALFSADGRRILTTSSDRTVQLRYTPEAIVQWLKTAKIPHVNL